MRVCVIDGCGRSHEAHGWCRMHYKRWAKWGDPLFTMTDPDMRFWYYVTKAGPDECWLWTGAPGDDGYGQFQVDGKKIPPFVYAYRSLVGPVPDGLVPDHLCRTPLCVNPGHIEPVSRRENVLRGISPLAVNAKKTECGRGHQFDEANTYVWKGGRHCRACRADTSAARR